MADEHLYSKTDAPQRQLDRLLRPRSVAIIGASAAPGSFGLSVLRNLERAKYIGEIHLINPKRSIIEDRPCLPSVAAMPEGVDCAVLAIPRAGVLQALEECARRRVGAAVIFSGGFAESGEEGRKEQLRIGQIARESGMVIQGPNCLGVVNYIDRVPLTFISLPAEAYNDGPAVAIVSQSGAMAVVLSVNLRARGLGLSFSVSTGNEASTGVEDYVEAMIGQDQTRVIAMIVEQFRDPKRFLALAGLAKSVGKQIVLLHPGSSSAARTSAATHTGAMAGDYDVMRTLVRHHGVLLVETLEELVDVTDILVRCPPYTQGGAMVFTGSGAFKALSFDLCERVGLPLPPLGSNTDAALRAILPDFIPPTNPLDITAQGLVDPEIYRRSLPPVLADDQYGSLVLSIILTDEQTSALKFPPIISALREIRPTKPVLFAGMDEGAVISSEYIAELRSLGVPFFPSPERAFRALARVAAHPGRAQQNRDTVRDSSPLDGLGVTGVLPEYLSKQVLARCGIRIPAGELARTEDEARSIAQRIGFPVVLKAQAKELTHKSDVGGVALNLLDAEALGLAWTKMYADIHKAMPHITLEGVLVEVMGARGVELIVGGRNDPDWGPVLLVGFGGVLAEALHDVRLLPADLDREAIQQELLQLKFASLLQGYRGSPALDIAAAAAIVEQLGRLLRCTPTIREVDINPVVVYPVGQGAIALDALIVTT